MKFKRTLSALLIIASALTLATSCKKEPEPEPDLITFTLSTSSTETTSDLRDANGNVIMTASELKTAYNFFSQYLRDYYYNQYLVYSQYYSIKDFDTFLSTSLSSTDQSVTFESQLRQDIDTRFINYIVCKKQFTDLGLSFTDEDLKEIDDTYNDMVSTLNESDGSNVSSACQKLSITQDQFKDYIVISGYRSNKLTDYYYGEDGKEPVTEEDLKENYDKNYTRFKAIILSTTDSNGKTLSDEKLQEVKDKAADIEAMAKKKGADFEKLIDEYSENIYDLSEITGDDNIKAAQEYNDHFRNIGFLYNENGYEQMFYATSKSALPSEIMDAAATLKTGEVTSVSASVGGIWIIKAYDINESEDLYEGVKDDIWANITSAQFNKLVKQWETALSYSFNETVRDSIADPKTREAIFAD